MKRSIYLFRHGQTDWNLSKRFQGHSNIPLNQEGREQAQRLGLYLKNANLEKIFSSDLDRAKETAQIVASYYTALEIETSALLREAHLGQMEGMHADDVDSNLGLDILKKWKSNDDDFLDMRLPGGESKRQMLDRVLTYLDDVIHSSELAKVGISTHGGVIHKLISRLLPDDGLDYPVTNCCLFVFEFYDSKYQFLTYKDFSKEASYE